MVASVALMSVFGLGIIFSIIGALKLELSKVLNIDDAKVGGLISALMFTSMIVVIIIGPLVDALGYKAIAITGFLVGFIAVFSLIAAKSYKTAILSCILLGISAMCVNTVGNTLMPHVLFGGTNAPAALNLGNTFFGIGAFLTPLFIGLMLKKLGYKSTGNIIAAVLLLFMIVAIFVKGFPQVPAGFPFTEALGLLSNGVIITTALALFCYIGIETSMGGWVSTYVHDMGFSEKGSNFALSGFWISLMIARLVAAGVVTADMGVVPIIVLSVMAFVTILIMIIAKSKPLALIGVLLTGFAFGPIFPTIIGVMFTKVDSSIHGSAFGITFAIGLIGASTIPAAIGYFAKGKSIQKSMGIALVTAALLIVMAIIMGMF